MASEKNALRAGSFIIISVVIALAVVIIVSGPDRFAPKKRYTAVFDLNENIQGVRAGTEVRLGGKAVGTVKDVTIDDSKEPPEIIVEFTMPTRYKLKQGATVEIEALIGGANLNISSFGTGAELPEGGRLDGQSGLLSRVAALAPKLESIMTQVDTKTLPEVNATIAEAKGLVTDVRPKVMSIATTAESALIAYKEKGVAVLDQAKIAMSNVSDFVGPATDAPAMDFRGTLANLKDATGTVKQELPALTEGAKKAITQLNERLESLKGTAEDLRASMANVKDVTQNVREILTDNRARIDRMIASLEATANNAKGFTSEVLRRPSKLIWRDDEKTQENLNVYHSAREFSEGAEQLNSAAGSLRDAIRDPRISSEELQRRLTNLESSFEQFNKVEDKLMKSVK